MDNLVLISGYLPFLLASFVTLISNTARDRSQYSVRQYNIFCLALMLWQGTAIARCAVKSEAFVRYSYSLELLLTSVLAMSLYRLSLGFYRIEKTVPKPLSAVITAIPLITGIFALTSPIHNIIFRDIVIYSLDPLVVVAAIPTVFYYAVILYSEAVVLITLYIIYTQNKQLPGPYQRGGYALIISIFTYAVGAFANSYFPASSSFDFTLIGISCGNILLYISVMSVERPDYQTIPNNQVLNFLDRAVFILGDGDQIFDANDPALRFVTSLERNVEHIPFERLMRSLELSGKIQRRPTDRDGGEDIYLISTNHPLIYHKQYIDIVGRDGNPLGRVASLKDVTRNRLLIERMRATAGIDILTNLPNRTKYVETRRELDRSDNLPISVIMGDVNGLKKVNDTFGHDVGDELLKEIGAILADCCPERGMAARIGGDEFIILIPKCDAIEATAIISRVKDRIDRSDNLPIPPAMAMGSATKTDPDEDLNTLIKEADLVMYSNKSGGANH